MEIDIKNIMAAYETATESEKTLLSTLFPDLSLGQTEKAPDDRAVTERIKTFEDAMLALGEEHPLVKEWFCGDNLSSDLEAYLKLRVICAALNEGWEPQYSRHECRWFPLHYLWTESELNKLSDEEKADYNMIMIGDKYQSEYAGLSYGNSYSASLTTTAQYCSRLFLKDKSLATYCGKQFIELWAAFMLTPKK